MLVYSMPIYYMVCIVYTFFFLHNFSTFLQTSLPSPLPCRPLSFWRKIFLGSFCFERDFFGKFLFLCTRICSHPHLFKKIFSLILPLSTIWYCESIHLLCSRIRYESGIFFSLFSLFFFLPLLTMICCAKIVEWRWYRAKMVVWTYCAEIGIKRKM